VTSPRAKLSRPSISAMPAKRMNRDEFFAKLTQLDEDGLRKVLWGLYWRGSASLRERIEGELEPPERGRRKQATGELASPGLVLQEVKQFAELARAGAYIAGDRRVSPKERTRWRLTFRQLAADAQSALHAEDAGPAEEALALIIDLACEMKDCEYFRSEDPVEAARFVVSDAASVLWETVRDSRGFAVFAQQAAAQLIRWESRYGWTRGWGKVCERETSLAAVLARMLRAPDHWTAFADQYLDALDGVAPSPAEPAVRLGSWGYGDRDYARRLRADSLAEWHDLLLDRLAGSEAEDRLDRLVSHPALGGPELTFLPGRLAWLRGDRDAARRLVRDCLEALPGHPGFARFAAEIGAEMPRRTRELAEQQWKIANS
jgi:uncharacterized protein YfiM (DUF2279 family)